MAQYPTVLMALTRPAMRWYFISLFCTMRICLKEGSSIFAPRLSPLIFIDRARVMMRVMMAPTKKRENANAQGSVLNTGRLPTKLSIPVTAAAINDDVIARR